MVLKMISHAPNGDGTTPVKIYSCDRCGSAFSEASPHTNFPNSDYCLSCSYIKGFFTEKEFLELSGISADIAKVIIRKDMPVICIGKSILQEKGG